MEATSLQAANDTPVILPEGVTQEELYDGPKPGGEVAHLAAALVKPIPAHVSPSPEVSSVPEIKSGYPAVLTAALDILSARLLGLLAVIAACGIWSFAVWDPTMPRTIAASLFSVTVLFPLVMLYWKAGMTGGGD